MRKTGDGNSSGNSGDGWVIPSPWEGAVIGGAGGAILFAYFGPVFAVTAALVGAVIGGLFDHYHHRVDAWREPKHDDPHDAGMFLKVCTALGLIGGGLALIALPFIVIFDP